MAEVDGTCDETSEPKNIGKKLDAQRSPTIDVVWKVDRREGRVREREQKSEGGRECEKD